MMEPAREDASLLMCFSVWPRSLQARVGQGRCRTIDLQTGRAVPLLTPVNRPDRVIVHELSPTLFNSEPKSESVSEHSTLSLRPLADGEICIKGVRCSRTIVTPDHCRLEERKTGSESGTDGEKSLPDCFLLSGAESGLCYSRPPGYRPHKTRRLGTRGRYPAHRSTGSAFPKVSADKR